VTEFRILLPFPCEEPRRVPPLTDPFRLEEDGRLAVLYLPEGSIVRLIAHYGLPSSHDTPDPYLALEWTLPEHGAQSTLYWNGDGVSDGWDWGSNNPPAEPEKAKRIPSAPSATSAPTTEETTHMPRNTRIFSDSLLDALHALPGVSVCYAHHDTDQPYRAWFNVEGAALARVLPLLAQSVATNYAGHPFRLLVDDTGDGESIGPIGTVVFCFESIVRGPRVEGQVAALGGFIATHAHEVPS